MLGVVREQPVGEPRELEEVVLLDDVLDRAQVNRAVPVVDELVLGVVRLARNAVEALVGTELDVARVVDLLQKALHRLVVTGLGRADEVVVGDVEPVPRVAEVPGRLVDQLLRRHALRLGRPLHFQTVLVGAGQIEDLVTAEPAPARENVARDGRVRVTDVRDVVDVIDGSRDVEARHGGSHCARPARRARSAFDFDDVADPQLPTLEAARARFDHEGRAPHEPGDTPRAETAQVQHDSVLDHRTRRRSGTASRTCAPDGTGAARARLRDRHAR